MPSESIDDGEIRRVVPDVARSRPRPSGPRGNQQPLGERPAQGRRYDGWSSMDQGRRAEWFDGVWSRIDLREARRCVAEQRRDARWWADANPAGHLGRRPGIRAKTLARTEIARWRMMCTTMPSVPDVRVSIPHCCWRAPSACQAVFVRMWIRGMRVSPSADAGIGLCLVRDVVELRLGARSFLVPRRSQLQPATGFRRLLQLPKQAARACVSGWRPQLRAKTCRARAGGPG